jgi:hypothetical protein
LVGSHFDERREISIREKVCWMHPHLREVLSHLNTPPAEHGLKTQSIFGEREAVQLADAWAAYLL